MVHHIINNRPLSGISYGFLSRRDGVSSGMYDSLNCGPGSDDNPSNVKQNRQKASALISGNPLTPLVSCYQVHGNTALPVTKDWKTDRPKADAMITKKRGILLGILTADCTPVLFADPAAGVVGAAHAGWKGALGGVLENTIAAMEKMGASRKHITAMIGPTIHQASYEVSTAFLDNFLAVDRTFRQFFLPGSDDDHYQFDLPGFVAHRLGATKIGHTANINIDTYTSNSHFSYRRTTHLQEPDYGRQVSAIMLKP